MRVARRLGDPKYSPLPRLIKMVDAGGRVKDGSRVLTVLGTLRAADRRPIRGAARIPMLD